MTNWCELEQLVNLHLDSHVGFAIFRLPDSSQISLIVQTEGEPRTLWGLLELDIESGFALVPFDPDSELPKVLIAPDVFADTTEKTLEILRLLPKGKRQNTALLQTRNISRDEYNAAFDKLMQRMQKDELDKVVLARSSEDVPLRSAGHLFALACQQNTSSFVYLCHSPLCGTWLGSSPETLVARSGDEYKTMALAGTRNVSETDEPWSLKDQLEQQYVCDYIIFNLMPLTRGISLSDLKTHRAGNVEHLRTDFTFRTDSGIGSLAMRLHPTPAVCGQPQEVALEALREVEPTERLYYSGIVGVVGTALPDSLFVNLRCLCADEQKTTFFAGGGLLPQSTADTEWDETEMKMKTLRSLLQE